MTNSINRNMISFKQHAEIEESSKKFKIKHQSLDLHSTYKKVFDRCYMENGGKANKHNGVQS